MVVHRARVAGIANEDMSEWASRLTDIATTAGVKWMVPPSVESLPPVPVPSWEKLESYITVGGHRNVTLHESTHHGPTKRVRTRGGARASPSGRHRFNWELPQRCRFGQQCIFTLNPVKAWQGGEDKDSSQPCKGRREDKLDREGRGKKKQDHQAVNDADDKRPNGRGGGGVAEIEDE